MTRESGPPSAADTPQPAVPETVVRGFEGAWRRGERPDLDAALAGLAGRDRAAALVELVHAELELRLKAGEPARVEDYLTRYPELSSQASVLLSLIDAEYRQRGRAEPALTLAEYHARFPGLAARLPTHRQTAPEPGARPQGASPGTEQAGGFDLRSYQLLDRVGQGGMGEVFRGLDPALGRDLALKVLRPGLCRDPDAERRFTQEARVTGALQHPNIVPVHNLGRLPDGRLYFTMKLVRGRTLAELLAQGHGPERLPELLGVFEKVCQAVAFAHSRGVLHRDLKPANVMVGAFGEVQVMDWGLARPLRRDGGTAAPRGETGEGGDTVRRALLTGSTADDRSTGVVGTPQYMAPEQARGEGDAVDERADVFGLGAVLCELLTGRPPFAGATVGELLRKAAEGDAGEALARLEVCGADAELVALCRDCLAAERAARPRDGGAVAERVAAYQAGVQERLRKAELERVAAQAREQEARATASVERKARRRTRALAVALLALAAVGAGSGLWVQHLAAGRRADRARREAEQRHLVESGLEKATGLRQQARWREATAVLEQARQALGEAGLRDLRQRLDVAQAELTLVNRLDLIRQRRATLVEGKYDTRTAVRDYAAAFRETGLGNVGDDEEAVAARVRASGVAGPLLAALDDWAVVAGEPRVRVWLLGVGRRAARDPWGRRFRSLAVVNWGDRQALQALAADALRDGGAKLKELSPQVLTLLGWLLRHAKGDAVPLLRAAQRRYPNDFWLTVELGLALGEAKPEQATGYFLAAVALRPDASVAHTNLGTALRAQGDLAGAIASLRRALELDSKNALAHNNLGRALQEQGDVKGALACYHTALRLDPRFAPAHNNLGTALFAQGDLKGAIAYYRQALALDRKYAKGHNNLGLALSKQGDIPGAIAQFRRAIKLDPKLAKTHYHLGIALSKQGDSAAAIACYKKASELDPKLALPHLGLGMALQAQGDLPEAMACYRKALDLDPKFAEAHHRLGTALYKQEDLLKAIACFRQALELDPRDASAHNDLGNALQDQKDLSGAVACFHRALKLDPQYPAAHYNLGNALSARGDLKGAISCYTRAIDLDPKFAPAHYNLGNALFAQEDLPGAIACYKTALDLDPKYAPAHTNLGNALARQGDRAGAIARYRQALELDPKYAPAHTNLGTALQVRGDLAGAIACHTRALELDPKYAPAHTNLGNALFQQGDFKRAVACYRKALEFDPNFADAQTNLGTALRAQGDLAGAIACYKKALTLNPKNATIHFNLGVVLSARGDLAGAAASYRQALKLAPNYANAHGALGQVLLTQGRFQEAHASTQQALQLLPNGHPLHPTVTRQLQACQRLLELDARLLAILKGDAHSADASEQLALADLCQRYRKRYAAAVRFFQGAFAGGAARTTDRAYSAACAALLAASGQGEDAGTLDPKECLRLRQQARRWLGEALQGQAQRVKDADAASRGRLRQDLQRWQQDTALATVRDAKALAQLPEAERTAWQQLWADIEGLLRKTQDKKK